MGGFCRAAHNSITTSPQTIRKLQVSPQKHQGRQWRRRPLCFLAPTRRRRLNSCLPIEFVGRRLNLLCMRQSPLPSLSRRRYSTCVLLFFRFFFIRHPDCVVRRAGSGNPSSRRRSIRQCGNMYNACTQFVCWGWAALSSALRNKFKRLHALVKAVLMMFSRKKKKKSTGLDVAPIIDSSVGDEWRRGRRNSRYCSKRKLTSPGTVVTTIVNDNKTSTTCYAPQTLPWRRFSFFFFVSRHFPPSSDDMISSSCRIYFCCAPRERSQFWRNSWPWGCHFDSLAGLFPTTQSITPWLGCANPK